MTPGWWYPLAALAVAAMDAVLAEILKGGPPCQTFSAAGHGAGRRALEAVYAAMDHLHQTGTGGAEPIAKWSRYSHRSDWLSTSTMPNATTRHITQPAPTIAFGKDMASYVFHEQGPGADLRTAKAEGEVARISVQEAAILQSLPADHPWQGGQGQQYQQVGNAIPGLLAKAVLECVL